MKSEPKKSEGVESFPEGADISVKSLNFSYDEDRRILSDVTLNVRNKGLVAFVGVSGCGKSTLAGILSGQLQLGDGMVFYGDIDINHIDREKLVAAVTRVSHDGHVFKGSIRSNLQIGNPTATDEEMIEALKEMNRAEIGRASCRERV